MPGTGKLFSVLPHSSDLYSSDCPPFFLNFQACYRADIYAFISRHYLVSI